MIYPNLFSAYTLKGKDWLRTIRPDDRQAFARIGLKESDYGKKGGKALYNKRGPQWMAEIGRRGALITNMKKHFQRKIQEEQGLFSRDRARGREGI